ncbi:hypothetical protein ACHHYP_20379 [Achlya hypogyna]|uniref:PWWP domain-containing protein n=1 Tax=Achlya hypogyna TaxID=1202772 RepID=A0A1V9ZKH3_ACHHY|nr:hypothetical protein ACHHYP_20379 [Achlya hypogyna]
MTAQRSKPAVSLQEGDVVWAKMKGFPWWPAVLFYSHKTLHNHGLPIPNLQPTMASPIVCFLDSFEYSTVPAASIVPFDFHSHKDQLKAAKKHRAQMKIAVRAALSMLNQSPDWTRDEYLEILAVDYNSDLTADSDEEAELPSKKSRAGSHRQDEDDGKSFHEQAMTNASA